MSKKVALITGITGQDGSYLAELLLNKDYEVHGFVRRITNRIYPNINHIIYKLHLHYVDIVSGEQVIYYMQQIKPDEIYNLAAHSRVGESFECPAYIMDVNVMGTLKLLEAMKNICPTAKFYQASSSEMYGNNQDIKYAPVSPYGVSKVAAHNICQVYKDSYKLFISCGILFNHESPRRGDYFVTKKIVNGVINILCGYTDRLTLGNLHAERDWGYAPEYVEAMWKILQLDRPMNIDIGTGENHTVGEFVIAAFNYVGISPSDGYVFTDAKYKRPNELNYLKADINVARFMIDWKPKVRFKELVKIMMDAALAKDNVKMECKNVLG